MFVLHSSSILVINFFNNLINQIILVSHKLFQAMLTITYIIKQITNMVHPMSHALANL